MSPTRPPKASSNAGEGKGRRDQTRDGPRKGEGDASRASHRTVRTPVHRRVGVGERRSAGCGPRRVELLPLPEQAPHYRPDLDALGHRAEGSRPGRDQVLPDLQGDVVARRASSETPEHPVAPGP